MGNPFVHVELHTDDLKAAKKFYRGLFDWKLEDMKMDGGMVYTMVGVGKGTGGGMNDGATRPCSSSCAIHSASRTSVLRPGTAFMCAAFSSQVPSRSSNA